MMTMGWKAGTGNASRVIDSIKIDASGNKQSVKYTLAALVQSNFGGARFLTVNGVPVGRILADEAAAAKKTGPMDGPEGSIIVVVATDAPLIPIQLQRIAKRATVGVARSELPASSSRWVFGCKLLKRNQPCLSLSAGGWGSNYSGDIFIAFSTAHEISRENTQNWTPSVPQAQEVLDTESINALFEATFEAVEEAICMFSRYGSRVKIRTENANKYCVEWLHR